MPIRKIICNIGGVYSILPLHYPPIPRDNRESPAIAYPLPGRPGYLLPFLIPSDSDIASPPIRPV